MHARRPFLLPALVSLSVVGRASTSAAAPIAETPRCRVSLEALSYDDPDSDDAEFLELWIERIPGPSPGSTDGGALVAVPAASCSTSAPDAGQGSDASSTAVGPGAGGTASDGGPTVLTVADCGLGSIELVNGGSGACDRYRTLAVGSLPVPDSGYLVLCAADSTLAAAGVCDTSSVGAAILKNGWIQNGPSDGLRFRGPSGELLRELAYEGGPACFASPVRLPDETGKLLGPSGAEEDDVSVLCGEEYRLVPASSAPLHAPSMCAAPDRDAGPGASGASDAAWVPEYAPPPSAGAPSGGAGGSAGAPSAIGGRTGDVPTPPSCRMAPPPGRSSRALSFLILASAALGLRRRTRLRQEPLRARSCARSGSSRPR